MLLVQQDIYTLEMQEQHYLIIYLQNIIMVILFYVLKIRMSQEMLKVAKNHN